MRLAKEFPAWFVEVVLWVVLIRGVFNVIYLIAEVSSQ